MIKIIKQLNERQTIINYEKYYYLVSESKKESGVPLETLVFQCDENGHINDWIDVDGEVGVGIKEFLPKLLERGYVGQ